MNTPIKSISEDQNEITHESGVVTVFEETRSICCNGCIYLLDCKCFSKNELCAKRIDNKIGIFKLKHNEHTI